jgi:hypothetical protein
MRAYTRTVNMSQSELAAWLANPRNLLASTATGHESLRRLAAGDHFRDPSFGQKADNFNTRHMLSGHLFGTEVGKSGWSKRHIALKNWGHDPSKPESPLHDADQVWLDEHAGAEARRSQRLPNPSVITSITSHERDAKLLADLAPFLAYEGARAHSGKGGRLTAEYVPTELLYADGRASTQVPFGPHSVSIGLLKDERHDLPSMGAWRTAREAVDLVKAEAPQDRGTQACLCQMRGPLERGIADRYDAFDRAPNPALGAWIVPIAQLIVSGSGLLYSSMNLARLISESRASAEGSVGGGEMPPPFLPITRR